MEEEDLKLFQPVVHHFYWYNDDFDEIHAKSFNIDVLLFKNKEDLEDYFEEKNDYETCERWTEYEIQFINGIESDDSPYEDEYEQSSGDWDNAQSFRTLKEAQDYRKILINNFKESDDKENWVCF